MKKITVSVGIPAYNEGNNILKIISDILRQDQKGWELKEIIVACDGSMDGTVTFLKSLKLPLIKIVENKVRKGKAWAINRIFKEVGGEVIVLFDADLRISGKNFINRLVFRLEKDNKVMLVAGNRRPFSPRNFIQEGIYSTFEVFDESRIKLKDGDNIFACQGGCLGLRKEFADKLTLPPIISDDAYMYLACISKGYKFAYEDRAVVNYKLANNLNDYLKQLFRSRPESVDVFLNKYFGDNVSREFHRPPGFYAISITKAFFKRPLPTLFIIMVNLLIKPFIPMMAKKYVDFWPIATSTK